MWAVHALSARQETVVTTAGRRARSVGGRGRAPGKELVELDAEGCATDMRERYTLALDLHRGRNDAVSKVAKADILPNVADRMLVRPGREAELGPSAM